MTDGGENKISVTIEAEIGKLQTQLKQAEKEVASSAKSMESIARKANIAFGIQTAATAVGLLRAAMKGMQGDWEGLWKIMEQMPLGIGRVASEIRELANEVSGFNAELAQMKAETQAMEFRLVSASRAQDIGEATREARAQTAEISTDDPIEKERIRYENELNSIEREVMAKRRKDLADGMQQDIAWYGELQEALTEKAEAEHRKRMRDAQKARDDDAAREFATIAKASEEAARLAEAMRQDEEEARHRGNAEAARLVEQNRRQERQARYREAIEDIEREMQARQEAGASMAAALAEAQGVRGANFVRSLSTSMGEFRFAQDGASEAVAKAQIRAAELLDKIEENTKAMTELQKEQKWINSLR